MHIDVKLFSRFREHLPAQARGEATLDLPDGTDLAGLLDHLGITARVQLTSINDQPESNRARVLHDGDEVRIFPFVVGG